MATYTELRDLFSDDALRNRVTTATVIAAQGLLAGSPAPTTAESVWASKVLSGPDGEGARMFMAVLAANSGQTVANIQGATDAQIQTNVDAVVPQIVAADNAVRLGT